MTDWKTRLRDSDPARHAELSAADVHRIRSVVLSAAHAVEPSAAFVWPRAFVVTTAALTLTCAVALVALQQNLSELRREAAVATSDRAVDAVVDTADASAQRQQLQFATPGGTRIIWVFDSEFEIKGTLP
jgi:hypothetical protein